MMCSMYFVFYLVMWLFLEYGFVKATSICDDKNAMKTICVAVRHGYTTQTTYDDVERVINQSVCKEQIALKYEMDISRVEYHTAAFCYVSELQTQCLINDENGKLMNLEYKQNEDYCAWNSNSKIISQTAYLNEGELIRKGLSKIIPPRKEYITQPICDDESAAKKLCVGVSSDNVLYTSYDQAMKVNNNSKCVENVKVVSETGYTIEYYKAALCYTNESFIQCVIDGYFEHQIIVVPYNLRSDVPYCIWTLHEVKSKATYLGKGSSLLTSTKHRFFNFLVNLCTGQWFRK